MNRKLSQYLKALGYPMKRVKPLLRDGKITINGKVGNKKTIVDCNDEIAVNGEIINGEDNLVYIAVNKPKRIVTTDDLTNISNIIDYVNYPMCLKPIGDLPKGDEGIVLMTNDPEVLQYNKQLETSYEKEYVAKVDKKINLSFLRQMQRGVPVLDKNMRVDYIEKIDEYHFRFHLTDKLNNRQLRLMCDYLGYHITRLMRVRVMDDITVNNLKKGKYRLLTTHEIDELKEFVLTLK